MSTQPQPETITIKINDEAAARWMFDAHQPFIRQFGDIAFNSHVYATNALMRVVNAVYLALASASSQEDIEKLRADLKHLNDLLTKRRDREEEGPDDAQFGVGDFVEVKALGVGHELQVTAFTDDKKHAWVHYRDMLAWHPAMKVRDVLVPVEYISP